MKKGTEMFQLLNTKGYFGCVELWSGDIWASSQQSKRNSTDLGTRQIYQNNIA